ncbi:MAG: 6-carboxytetrahydropterin synthase QueD [Planctomycetota bacterium]|jgi:6-pyruvoyltetrahydropterin/6-carboxytetrahydropterin synthase
MFVRLAKSFTFEAAHWLPCFPEGHKCRRMHGHSFRVDIIVAGDVPADQHYLVDFGDIAKAVRPIHDALDHRCLNEIDGLEVPTSEVLAEWIFARLAPNVPHLAEVHVAETCTARCEYRASEQGRS